MVDLLRLIQAPSNPQTAFGRHLRAADAANRARDWPLAERRYAAALALDPLRADLWVQYGHALAEQGRPAEAEGAYRQATARAPLLADAHHHLARLLQATGRTAETHAAIAAGLRADPAHPGLRAQANDCGLALEATQAPAPFRDLDDLPLRSAQGIPRPAPARAFLRDTLRGLPARLNPGRPRDALVFIHLHKTGGLTLDEVLARHFSPARICPVKDDHLHLFSPDALDGFDLISGHIDAGALRLLRRPFRTVSVFRDPRARLISFYRFHAGHDLGGRHAVNAFAQMANAMSAEAFFEDPRVRQAPEVFNHYLVAFGLSYHQVLQDRPVEAARVTEAVVARAVARVRALDAVGLLERFDDSVDLACHALGYPPPRRVKAINQSDALARRMKGTPVPKVAMTPRLAAALADLTRFDEVLYAAAKDEFTRRFARFRPDASS